MNIKNNNHRFEIVRLKQQQLPEVADFLVKHQHGDYNKQEWINKFDLFWNSNPWFDKSKHSRGWVIINANNELEGFIGSIPIVYLRKGRIEEAFCATTWVVSNDARGQSLNLYSELINQGGVIFSTTTEPKIKKIITQLFGYDEITPAWIKFKYVIPLNLKSSFKFISSYHKNNILKKITYNLGNVFFKFLAINYRAFHRLKKTNINIQQCDCVPKDIELFNSDFIEKYKYVFPRNFKNINWLYFSNAQSSSRLLLEVRENSKLIGLVSFKCIVSNGVARLELLDFSMLYITRVILQSVIIEVQKISKEWRKDIAFITFYSFSDMMNVELIKSGFYKSKNTDSFFIRTQPLHSQITDIYTSPLDGDRPFFP